MIVLLTALDVEYDAIRDHLGAVDQRTSIGGTIFDVGAPADHPGCGVALGLVGTGAVTAAALTERALTEFTPTAIFFVGVAGGLRDWLEIGDVIVATKIHSYQGGRSENDEFMLRPNVWQVSHEVEQVAHRLRRDPRWRAGLPGSGDRPAPAVYFEAVAAGDVVLNSKTSWVAEHLRRHHNDAVAIEKESSGFAQASQLHRRATMATIRGISDRADGTKSATDSGGGQQRAAASAAAFALALAAAVDEHGAAGNLADARRVPSPATPDTTNIIKGGQVGAQTGVNYGHIHTTWAGAPGRE